MSEKPKVPDQPPDEERVHLFDDQPRSVFNRIAESGMNFVRNVLENPTRHDLPVLDLDKSKSGSQFDGDEVSQVEAYNPGWEGKVQAPPKAPQFGGPKTQEEFTQFRSAIRQWRNVEANKSLQKPRRRDGRVVIMPRRNTSRWKLIVVIFVVGGLGVSGLYMYKFVDKNLLAKINARFGYRQSALNDTAVGGSQKESQQIDKKRYNKPRKKRRQDRSR